MSIKKIVADYETCKKAHEAGLIIKSVFSWYSQGTGGKLLHLSEDVNNPHWYITAPTAEEVPLPFDNFCPHGELEITRESVAFNTYGINENSYQECYVNCLILGINEATARLKMAIWLIENVPEAKQWYVDNNYLRGDNAK